MDLRQLRYFIALTEYRSFVRAAEAMGITAERLKSLDIVDKVIPEPLGGAHRDPAAMSESIRAELVQQLDMLSGLDHDALLARRYDRLMSYGV